MRGRYLEKILVKRHREKGKNTDRKSIVVYDMDVFECLTELARKESTTVSAILNNLYEVFLTQIDSPQKTIESFKTEHQIPPINASPQTWRLYLKTLSKSEYKEQLDKHLNSVLALCNRRFNEYG